MLLLAGNLDKIVTTFLFLSCITIFPILYCLFLLSSFFFDKENYQITYIKNARDNKMIEHSGITGNLLPRPYIFFHNLFHYLTRKFLSLQSMSFTEFPLSFLSIRCAIDLLRKKKCITDSASAHTHIPQTPIYIISVINAELKREKKDESDN